MQDHVVSRASDAFKNEHDIVQVLDAAHFINSGIPAGAQQVVFGVFKYCDDLTFCGLALVCFRDRAESCLQAED